MTVKYLIIVSMLHFIEKIICLSSYGYFVDLVREKKGMNFCGHHNLTLMLNW